MHKILIMTDFALELLEWYSWNKRLLPWRETNDAYKVWLSEIIMQQTQVVQGTEYYLKFIETYPEIDDLANASEEEVLKLWQGLGYYSRARNLHATAKIIVSDYQGYFPKSHKEILKLKGVGPYTAAAIASICFNLPHAVVDGNVYRFISRLKGISTPIDSTEGKKEFALIADDLLNRQHPGDHNQAMMEFGALVCRPVNPDCNGCPFANKCIALAQGKVDALPVKAKKTKQRHRYLIYLWIENKEGIYIEKRTSDGIWKNLYQFPLLEFNSNRELKQYASSNKKYLTGIDSKKHILSHQILHVIFYKADKKLLKTIKGEHINVAIEEVHKYPFPQVLANFLDERTVNRQD